MEGLEWGPCKKNQNFNSSKSIHDDCLQFSHPENGCPFCEACGCHRSFHEQQTSRYRRVEDTMNGQHHLQSK